MLRSLAILVILFVATPSLALAQTNPNLLITPGEGIGSINVGMTIADMVVILGTPKVTRQSGQAVRYFWFDFVDREDGRYFNTGGLYVKTGVDGKVVGVNVVRAPQYVTDKGLHTGMTEKDIIAAMGEPSKVLRPDSESHFLVYPGIAFEVIDSPKYFSYRQVYLISISKPE